MFNKKIYNDISFSENYIYNNMKNCRIVKASNGKEYHLIDKNMEITYLDFEKTIHNICLSEIYNMYPVIENNRKYNFNFKSICYIDISKKPKALKKMKTRGKIIRKKTLKKINTFYLKLNKNKTRKKYFIYNNEI